MRFLPILREEVIEHAHIESLVSPILNGEFQAFHHRAAASAWDLMFTGIQNHDFQKIQEGTSRLSGLGPGLTPAGDDFLMGVIYSHWVMGENSSNRLKIDRIARVAGERTNTLSRAWLQAASHGEAAAPWHKLVAAVISGNPADLAQAVNKILEIGSSSGADALAGFLAASQLLNSMN